MSGIEQEHAARFGGAAKTGTLLAGQERPASDPSASLRAGKTHWHPIDTAECLQWAAAGMSFVEIGRRLDRSAAGVESHLQRLIAGNHECPEMAREFLQQIKDARKAARQSTPPCPALEGGAGVAPGEITAQYKALAGRVGELRAMIWHLLGFLKLITVSAVRSGQISEALALELLGPLEALQLEKLAALQARSVAWELPMAEDGEIPFGEETGTGAAPPIEDGKSQIRKNDGPPVVLTGPGGDFQKPWPP